MRRRLFAWAYARGETVNRRMTGALRRELVSDLSGDVLEIGCGTGTNFAFYDAAARVTATDPNPHMLRRAADAARAAGARVSVEVADAGALPFEDGAFDAVVSTLVLCSVPDLPRALAEESGACCGRAARCGCSSTCARSGRGSRARRR